MSRSGGDGASTAASSAGRLAVAAASALRLAPASCNASVALSWTTRVAPTGFVFQMVALVTVGAVAVALVSSQGGLTVPRLRGGWFYLLLLVAVAAAVRLVVET